MLSVYSNNRLPTSEETRKDPDDPEDLTISLQIVFVVLDQVCRGFLNPSRILLSYHVSASRAGPDEPFMVSRNLHTLPAYIIPSVVYHTNFKDTSFRLCIQPPSPNDRPSRVPLLFVLLSLVSSPKTKHVSLSLLSFFLSIHTRQTDGYFFRIGGGFLLLLCEAITYRPHRPSLLSETERSFHTFRSLHFTSFLSKFRHGGVVGFCGGTSDPLSSSSCTCMLEVLPCSTQKSPEFRGQRTESSSVQSSSVQSPQSRPESPMPRAF